MSDLQVKYRVCYAVQGVPYGIEYSNREEAHRNLVDICGYDHITDCRLEVIRSSEPLRQGPFQLNPPETRFDREEPL